MRALRSFSALALASLAACVDASDLSPDDAPTVARIRPEPAGEHCADGGRAVLGGPDLDGDGALDDDEVVTTDPLCTPGDGARPMLRGGAIASGDVIIDSTTTAEQLAALGQLQLIRGTLTIQHGAIVSLPALEVVLGGVVVHGTVQEVALPRLDEISGDLRVAGTLLSTVDLGALRKVGGALAVEDTVDAPIALALPRLLSIGGHLHAPETGSLAAPVLAQIDGSLILEGRPAAIALPALTRIGDVLSLGADAGRLDLSAVTHVGDLSVYYPVTGEVRLPGLATIAGDLEMFAPDVTALALPRVTSVGGTLLVKDAHQYGGLRITAIDLRALESAGNARVLASALRELDLRALRSTGSLQLSYLSSLTTVSLPALTRVDTLGVLLTGLTSLDLSALETVGSLGVHGNPALTALIVDRVTALDALRVSGNPRLFALGAHALAGRATAEIEIVDNPALVAIEAPLTTAGKLTLSGLALTDLRALTTLASVSTLVVSGNARLASTAGLGALATAGSIELRDNPALVTVADLPRLKALTGNLVAVGNAKLAGVDGLKAIKRIDGAVTLERNAAMKKLTGLDKVVQIGRALRIADNAALEHLGLAALRAVGGTLTIKTNPKLPASEPQRVRTQTTPANP